MMALQQVFLSHSGKQKNFARHLFKEMERHNISCFFDEDPQSLRIAEEFPPRIFEAAMNCSVGVVVLSEEFISTKWPMQELVTFVEAQNTTNTSLKILPLFFTMSPDALAQKLQQKDLLKSWQELQISQRKSINFDKWTEALQALRRINGIKYNESEGEVAYIDKIVAHIRDMLPPRLIYDESDVHGRERLCQEVARLVDRTLCVENGVRIAGLYGVEGIGKTTIAKILCNFYSKDFDGRVLHVELGKAKSKKTLKSALRILCGASQSLVNSVMTMEEGWYLLKQMMLGRRVFLALDNVSDECIEEVRMYLKAVCQGNRSTILLTARSLSILKPFIQEGDRSCMPVPFLQEEEAIAVLLKRTPFKLSNLTTEQKGIASKCIQECCFRRQYHPLALQIFGAFLFDKFQGSWAHQSKKWIDVPNIHWNRMQRVFSIFKASFMSLSLQHRKIFLLSSLYLPPSCDTLEKAINWLAVVCSTEVGHIEYAIFELERKGFIERTKESGDGLDIHDLLRAFAVSEADGTGKWLYLKGADEIPFSLQESVSNDRPKFWAMKFVTCHFESPGIINNKLFADILVLHLEDMPRLKILDLSSMKIVRSITLIGCSGLEEIRGLKSLTNLVYLLIRGCPVNVRFCPGIECLRALQHLEVRANLQEMTITPLQYSWGFFPPLQDMSSMSQIRLDHIGKGRGPLNLVGCSKLQTIEISNCNISLLDLTGCSELRTIEVRWCRYLSGIRLSNAGCSTANMLPMPGCANSDSDPLEGTGGWGEFSISSISRLSYLESLTLESLTLYGTDSLRELPSLDRLPNLITLQLGGMDSLRELPSLRGLSNLVVLEMWGLGSLRELPGLDGLTELATLELRGMSSLRELPSLSRLSNLEVLVLIGMDNLRELPSLSGFSNLETLGLFDMGSLNELPALNGLPKLLNLGLGHLRNLNTIFDFHGLFENGQLPRIVIVAVPSTCSLADSVYYCGCGATGSLCVPYFGRFCESFDPTNPGLFGFPVGRFFYQFRAIDYFL